MNEIKGFISASDIWQSQSFSWRDALCCQSCRQTEVMYSMTSRARKLTGYCNRCGGDYWDDGVRAFHKCPPKRPEAAAIVSLKFHIDSLRGVIDRRPWTAIVRKEDCADLISAMRQAREALDAAYPNAAIGEKT